MKHNKKSSFTAKILCLIAGITILSLLILKYGEYDKKEENIISEESAPMTELTNSATNPAQMNGAFENKETPTKDMSNLNPVSDTEISPDCEPIADPEPIAEPDIMPQTFDPETDFYAAELSEEIKQKISGVSYHENDNITYDDLRFLQVLYVDFHGETQRGELICNKAIADDLLEIFRALYDASYQIDKIRLIDEYGGDDDLSCDDNNSSCFNYRVVGGTDTLSKHALGLAVDINPMQNPYITYPDGIERISPKGSEPYADRDSGLDHMILEGDLCYNLFIEHGFTWGGHWKTLKDYQHFQKTLE